MALVINQAILLFDRVETKIIGMQSNWELPG